MENQCRICLCKKDTMYSLFRKRKGICPYETLMKYTKLKLRPGDYGPTCICVECIIEMDTTMAFLDKCERSQQMFALSVENDCSKKTKVTDEQVLIESSNVDGNLDIVFHEESLNHANKTREPEINKKELMFDVVGVGLQSQAQCPECGSRRRCKHWAPPITFTCQYCHKVFNRKFNFTLHVKRHLGAREWACEACGSLQVSQWLARRHCARARRLCPVPACGKTFTTNTNLATHMRRHTGERPFECAECDKRFICKNTLSDHLKIHTGVKAYLCSVCGARFTTNKLAAHAATHAAPAHRLRHACPAPHCTAKFASARALRLHNAVHGGGGGGGVEAGGGARRTHTCALCGARYKHTQSLNKHRRKQHPHTLHLHQHQRDQDADAADADRQP